MQIKLKFSLCVIIILMVITIIIGCACQQYKAKGITERTEAKGITERTIDAEKRTIEKPKTTIEIEIDKEVDAQTGKPTSLGEFKLTAYCPCEICCESWANNRPNEIVYGAIGEELKEGYSIAVDPNIISYGTEVMINGRTYKAQDCGGAIKGNRIDVYFESHEDALEFGVQYANVYIIPH